MFTFPDEEYKCFSTLKVASVKILVCNLISITEKLFLSFVFVFCLLLRMLRKREGGPHLAICITRITKTPPTKY